MSDAERDAWLREALRHAPDAGALPPSGVSETILASARASVRQAPPTRRRSALVAAFGEFWAWLARPPVAAGFASLMAATLVGLMWWDRPMDEALPPRPSSRPEVPAAPAPSRTAAPAAAAAPTPDQSPQEAAPAAPRAEATNVERPAARRAPTLPSASTEKPSPAREPLRDAKVIASPAPPSADRDALAKERGARAERRDAAAAQLDAATAAPRASPPTAASFAAAKKAEDAISSRSAAAPVATPATVAEPVPPAPTGGARAGAPPPSGGARAGAGAPAETTAANAEQNALAAAPTEAARRQRAFGELRDKDAAADPQRSAAAAAPLRSSESERARSEAQSRSAPLAAVLASIAAEPDRWARRTDAGDAFALDAGWRDWLREADAAAAGRWLRAGGEPTPFPTQANGSRLAPTTLRLQSGGRPAATVRLSGRLLQLETDSGEHWQALLDAAMAERLGATARRLSP